MKSVTWRLDGTILLVHKPEKVSVLTPRSVMIMFVSFYGTSMFSQRYGSTLGKQNPLKSLIIELGRQVLVIGTTWQRDPVGLREDNDSVSKVELQMGGGTDS